MCGISGVVVKENAVEVTKNYFNLLKASDIRGQDGTGIAIWRNGEIIVKRWECRAREITDFPLLQVGDIVIGQNRYAIFGLDSTNNQPIVLSKIAIVHNGVLYNYEEQFKALNLKRELKVDTELILRLIERHLPSTKEDLLKVLHMFEGEAACLVFTAAGQFLTFMKNKILFSGEDINGNEYYFSTERIVKKVPEICSNIHEFENLEIGSV